MTEWGCGFDLWIVLIKSRESGMDGSATVRMHQKATRYMMRESDAEMKDGDRICNEKSQMNTLQWGYTVR